MDHVDTEIGCCDDDDEAAANRWWIANGQALSTSTLQLLDQNGPNKEESKSALHNWKDISTSNIDDALQSLHDSSIIAELECSNDVVSNDDTSESNCAPVP
jgi:hypothetical protein